MKKIDIIKLLDKEVWLFKETTDEDELGNEYLTAIQFNQAENALSSIIGKRNEISKFTDQLRKLIEDKDKRLIIVTSIKDETLMDKQIYLTDPMIILDNTGLTITNCIFNTKTLRK